MYQIFLVTTVSVSVQLMVSLKSNISLNVIIYEIRFPIFKILILIIDFKTRGHHELVRLLLDWLCFCFWGSGRDRVIFEKFKEFIYKFFLINFFPVKNRKNEAVFCALIALFMFYNGVSEGSILNCAIFSVVLSILSICIQQIQKEKEKMKPRKLLSRAEFETEGVEFTLKQLEEMKKFSKSSGNMWEFIPRLKNPQK